MPPPSYIGRLQRLARFASSRATSRLPKPTPLIDDAAKPPTNRSSTKSNGSENRHSPPENPRLGFSHRLWRIRQQWRHALRHFDPQHRRLIWKGLWLLPYIPILYVVDRHFIAILEVTGPSMTPTLNANFKHDEPNTKDSVLVSLYDAGRRAKRGDIIIFRTPKDPERLSIKRIVADQGDIVQPLPPYPSDPIIVPWGQIWVEGDTQDRSQTVDSNTFGPIPRGLVVGKVLTILWPFDHFGGFPSIENSRVTKRAIRLRDPDEVITERETYWKDLRDKLNREKRQSVIAQPVVAQPVEGKAGLAVTKESGAAQGTCDGIECN